MRMIEETEGDDPTKPPVLLCYHLGDERRNQIRLLGIRLKIRVRMVEELEYGQTLAALCGLEPLSPTTDTVFSFDSEMLVLANFTTEQINQFLYGFKRAGIPPVQLKAVLTQTNMHWDAVTLYDQLKAEHEALANGQPPAHDAE